MENIKNILVRSFGYLNQDDVRVETHKRVFFRNTIIENAGKWTDEQLNHFIEHGYKCDELHLTKYCVNNNKEDLLFRLGDIDIEDMIESAKDGHEMLKIWRLISALSKNEKARADYAKNRNIDDTNISLFVYFEGLVYDYFSAKDDYSDEQYRYFVSQVEKVFEVDYFQLMKLFLTEEFADSVGQRYLYKLPELVSATDSEGLTLVDHIMSGENLWGLVHVLPEAILKDEYKERVFDFFFEDACDGTVVAEKMLEVVLESGFEPTKLVDDLNYLNRAEVKSVDAIIEILREHTSLQPLSKVKLRELRKIARMKFLKESLPEIFFYVIVLGLVSLGIHFFG